MTETILDTVLSPFQGTVLPLSAVPDPVFSQGMVGGGVTVEPQPDAGSLTVVAPISGKVVKIHPHAFVILHESGSGVLVHVGIDTVGLKGQGFTVLAAEGSTVSAGDPMVVVDFRSVRDAGLSASCPVVVLDSPADAVSPAAEGAAVEAGDPLYSLPSGR